MKKMGLAIGATLIVLENAAKAASRAGQNQPWN